MIALLAPLLLVWAGGSLAFGLAEQHRARRRRRNPRKPAPRKGRRKAAGGARSKRAEQLAEALRAIERDTAACEAGATCYEPGRDRRGRRRRCRTTFRSKAEAVAAVDRAMDGALFEYLERADPGSPDLRDLEEATEDRRGRRRRLPTWWDAVAWTAPTTRRWEDFDRGRLELVSEALARNLSHGGGPEPLPLMPPLETQRLEEAEQRRQLCAVDGADRVAAIKARPSRSAPAKRRKQKKLPAWAREGEVLPPLSEVPF